MPASVHYVDVVDALLSYTVICGEILRLERLLCTLAARATAMTRLCMRLERVIAWPSLFVIKAASAPSVERDCPLTFLLF
jgi:hypothetical protein